MRLFLTLLAPALAWAGLCSSASAVVVYFPGQNIPIPSNFAGVSVDLDGGGTSNDLNGLPNGDANFYFGGANISNDADVTNPNPTWQPVRLGTNQTSTVDNLAFNVSVVGPGSTYAVGGTTFGSSNDHVGTEFTNGVIGYIGFSLIPNGGGGPFYGWMEVTLNDDGNPGTIHRWAYDDTGAPIIVGVVPEPGTGALALLGLAALAVRRRRR